MEGTAAFDGMNDVSDAIADFEDKTSIKLRVNRSDMVKTTARTYVCATHQGCPFYLKFGSRRRDGMVVLKSYENKHFVSFQSLVAADGRRWKQRRYGKYEDEYQSIARRKAGTVQAADLVKTVQNQKGEDIPYHSAWRVVQQEKKMDYVRVRKSFQMIPSYARAFSKINPGSTSDCV